jgi:hypothetical protein
MSIFAAVFWSSHVISPGSSVVSTRWIHRAAFVGTATRARSCCHPFFMLRFLAGRSARADGSLTGRAGRGLGLSRRNERRAEQRRNDEGRDCKFGSHQKISVGYWNPPNLGHAIQFRRGANIARISYSKKPVREFCADIHHFPNIRHFPNIGFAQSASNGLFAYWGIRSVRGRYQGQSSLPKMRGDDGIADHRARKIGFRFAHFRMPEVLRHRSLGSIDLP